MNNNKGLTLIELLATITLIGVVFAVGSMLLSSVNFEFKKSNSNFKSDRDIYNTMNYISRNLTDAVGLYRLSANEVRLVTGEGATSSYIYKSLVYDSTAGTLKLYQISQTNYTNKTVLDYSLSANYSNVQLLASNLTKDSSMTVNEVVVNSDGTVQSEPSIAYPSSIYDKGKVIKIELPFTPTRDGVAGGTTSVEEKASVTIKLLKY
jgi:prepilin-type N-terminal cleavage/methylation domain-containing protein